MVSGHVSSNTRRTPAHSGARRHARQTRTAWARVEAWVEQHAPRNFTALPLPRTEEQIRAHETLLPLGTDQQWEKIAPCCCPLPGGGTASSST
ncbi:hypothetical protein AB0B50_19590 [Streptomyces sp. NPDC041068]|uniref:hypothetical protein n=1 Tax=Streptomyces sp. NPDC041068 TaxID=3155130 RepID=UPI0033E77CDF